jgi:NTE family protein
VDIKTTFERPDGSNGREVPRRGSERPPSLGETLTRVLLLASKNTSDTARRYADLTIKPQVGGIGFLEFHQIDAAREAGRAAVRRAIADIPAAPTA